MNSIADSQSKPTTAETFVPSFPTGLLRTLAVDLALPWIAVQVLTHQFGVSPLSAVVVAALFPAMSLAATWLRRGRLEMIGLIVLTTLVGGLAVALAAQDPRIALIKGVPGATLFGVACLATLARRAPLMFYVARQFTAGDDAAKLAAWTDRLASAGFRRAMRVLTLVWGVAFVAKAALWTGAALWLPLGAAMAVNPALGIGIFAALMTWTIAFARRGAARIAALEADEGEQR